MLLLAFHHLRAPGSLLDAIERPNAIHWHLRCFNTYTCDMQHTKVSTPTSARLSQTHSADVAQRRLVLEVLDDAKQLNLTVLRCWAFCDGPDEWNALQPEPGAGTFSERKAGSERSTEHARFPSFDPFAGKFNENIFAGLDWLIMEAGLRGIRCVLLVVG